MSFAKRVKEELTNIPLDKERDLAELAAMIEMNTELSILDGEKTLWFNSNNPTVVRRFLKLLKSLYKVDSTLLTKKESNFKRGFQIKLGVQEALDEIILEHSIFTEEDDFDLIVNSKPTKASYLRGAFLSSGSVNSPKTAEYHLEIYSENKNVILKIQRFMNDFDLNTRITTRRKGVICYLKDASKIEDFLRIIGASTTVFQYENFRIQRDFNNSINRILNCEIANEKKVLMAANDQLKYIKLIEKHEIKVDAKIKQAIELRKGYPEASLAELVDYFEDAFNEKITKSGLNHRYSKIKNIALEIKGNII